MGGAHNLLYSNDREGEHAPSLYAAQSAGFPAQPALAGDVGADVCIIGAGFTGLSAALHLAQRGYRVRVLEAHRVGWGASGRNGGQVGSGQRMDQAWLEKRYGNVIARQYWDVAEDAKALVRQLISEHAIDCHPIDGILHANHRERYVEESHAYAAHLQNRYGYGRRLVLFAARKCARSSKAMSISAAIWMRVRFILIRWPWRRGSAGRPWPPER